MIRCRLPVWKAEVARRTHSALKGNALNGESKLLAVFRMDVIAAGGAHRGTGPGESGN